MPKRDLNRVMCLMLLVALVFAAACSHIERFKRPLTHRVDPRVRQEEVIRIDDEIYVKVPNPEGGSGEAYTRYRYVPLEEYLANPESYQTVVATTSATGEEEEWRPVEVEAPLPNEAEELVTSHEPETPSMFKKRLMVAPFKDLSNPSHKRITDLVTQKVASEIQAMSDQVILFDADIMKQEMQSRKLGLKSFDSPEVIQLAGQFYNIHAIVMGSINHLFVSSTESRVKGNARTTYAIADLSAWLVDTTSGRVQQLWEKRNSIFDSESEGDFSEEKAQLKAITLITSELASDIVEELKRINWFATIANVDGTRVYISAGKLSGLRVGDILSVYPPAFPSNPKGEIRVATFFGMDASVADITRGNGFKTNDVVRPVFQ